MTKKCSFTTTKISQLFLMCLMSESLVHFFNVYLSIRHKGSFQKRFSVFFPLRGYPPPPLNGKSFCQKTLSGKGGYPPPPLNGRSPKNFLKNGSKRAKITVFRPKIAVFAYFFLNGIGGFPPPPLTESPLSFSGKFFPKRAKNDVFFIK